MVDLIANISHGDVSSIVAFLLSALLALLLKTWRDLGERLAKADKVITRLSGFRQNHDIRLRLIENHCNLETIEYDPGTDNE